MDYVTCGTGQLLRLRRDHADPPVRRHDLGVADGRRAEAGRAPRPGAGREPHPYGGERRGGHRRRRTPTWCRSSAVRSPIRISSPRPRAAGRTTCAPASRATRCAGDGGRATTGSPASSTRRSGARSSGAATGSSPAADRRGRCWSSAAARPASRRPVWPPSAATESPWSRPDRPRRCVPARRPAAAARPDRSTCWTGTNASSNGSASTSGSGTDSTPSTSPPSAPTTSSWPPDRGRRGTGFQRRWPAQDRAARRRAARRARRGGRHGGPRPTIGRRVVVLDDTGDWRGGRHRLAPGRARPRRGRRHRPPDRLGIHLQRTAARRRAARPPGRARRVVAHRDGGRPPGPATR